MTDSLIADGFVYGGAFGLVVRLMFSVVLRRWMPARHR